MGRNRHFGYGASTFGEDTQGHDVKAFGDTTGKYFFWDASANTLTVNGVTKFRNRPTTDAYSTELKSEFTGTATAHYCVPVTADWHPSATATAGGIQALQGTARLYTDHTATGGSIIGTYGQACNLGTLNGAGVMVAGLYGLIEDGGTWQAVSHVASAWLDSHLAQTVTAGESELLYMSNNGATVLNQAMFIYGGNKITNLMRLQTVSGMVSANTAAKTTLDFTNWVTIKINIDGTTHYIPAARTITATGA